MTSAPARIVVFAGALPHQAAKTIVESDRRLGGAQWLVVTQGAADQDEGAADRPGAEYRPGRLLAQPNVTHFDAAAARSELAARITEFAPDIGLVLAAAPLPPGLADVPRLGTIRLHHGRLPDYAGDAPVFWALWHGDTALVATIELLSATGWVIAEAVVARPKFATPGGMELLLGEAGMTLLGDVLAPLLSGKVPPPVRGTMRAIVRPQPTPAQRRTLERRIAAALPDRGPFYRETAKSAYLCARLVLGRLASALSARPFVTVLTYHRVNDDLRDNVTVGIEQFDRQMALLAQRCQPVSIEDVVAGKLPPRPARPLVSVTFDDGYKDNYTIALPILLKHQVPAAFFVSTGFIGTTTRFPHDLQKGLTDLPNMGWDDLRAMRRHGYVIGSHTTNHVDCAKTPSGELRRELADSRAALEREVGVVDPIFAYPFGRTENMTAEALERVREAGYVGCLSSFGGINRGSIDPFDVRRSGVNWPFSNLGFLCRAWGLA